MPRRPSPFLFGLAALYLAVFLPAPAPAGDWTFTDVTAASGLASAEHGFEFGFFGEPDMMAGGVAAADIDRDGDVDLLVVRGDLFPVALYRNRGNGVFDEVGSQLGLAITGGVPNGAAFADVDGNGAPDLILGGLDLTEPRLFLNDGFGVYQEATVASGLSAGGRDTWSAAFGDYDKDGDLDLALAHWWRDGGGTGHLWQNQGDGTFTDVGVAAGIGGALATTDYTFTPSFADLDSDGWPDLLMAADFGTTRVFENDQDGTFTETTGAAITDENGMGSAVGDYDNDGDLDWFVSSIWDPDGVPNGNWGVTGNRLYQNDGNGQFTDVTTAAGVRVGYWGWGSCMADFNNDGHLDIFHTNGMSAQPAAEFHADPARIFVSNGNGTFTERSVELGLAAPEQGRGISCFDADRDGDVDLFVQNNSDHGRMFRNDGGNVAGNWLSVLLKGPHPNSQGVGARVYVTTPGGTQMRELQAGNNFLSSDPVEAHFGLGGEDAASQVRVVWPDGHETLRPGVPANRLLRIARQGVSADFSGNGRADVVVYRNGAWLTLPLPPGL